MYSRPDFSSTRWHSAICGPTEGDSVPMGMRQTARQLMAPSNEAGLIFSDLASSPDLISDKLDIESRVEVKRKAEERGGRGAGRKGQCGDSQSATAYSSSDIALLVGFGR